MPTVLLINGYRFYFFSNENGEPVHIHVEKAEGNAKLWLDTVRYMYSYGFTKRQQKQILEIVAQNLELLKTKWNEYFA